MNSFSPDSAASGESPLEVSPEPLQFVDMVLIAFTVLAYLMLHQTMDITVSRYAGVTLSRYHNK